MHSLNIADPGPGMGRWIVPVGQQARLPGGSPAGRRCVPDMANRWANADAPLASQGSALSDLRVP
jgi:hypothetical protein